MNGSDWKKKRATQKESLYFRKTPSGAQVAPQHCPILRKGKSTYRLTRLIWFVNPKCGTCATRHRHWWSFGMKMWSEIYEVVVHFLWTNGLFKWYMQHRQVGRFFQKLNLYFRLLGTYCRAYVQLRKVLPTQNALKRCALIGDSSEACSMQPEAMSYHSLRTRP